MKPFPPKTKWRHGLDYEHLKSFSERLQGDEWRVQAARYARLDTGTKKGERFVLWLKSCQVRQTGDIWQVVYCESVDKLGHKRAIVIDPEGQAWCILPEQEAACWCSSYFTRYIGAWIDEIDNTRSGTSRRLVA